VALPPQTTLALPALKLPPGLLPSTILLTATLTAGYIFWLQGEIDPYAPPMMGIGLWIFWRMDHGGVIRAVTSGLYTTTLTLLVIDRARPHLIYLKERWVQTEFSPGLLLCGVLIVFAWGLSLLYRARARLPIPPPLLPPQKTIKTPERSDEADPISRAEEP
jgi:hypothetical protein